MPPDSPPMQRTSTLRHCTPMPLAFVLVAVLASTASAKLAELDASGLRLLYPAPRLSAPRRLHEGIAVFCLTWMAGGSWRSQGAYDEMLFRSMVRDSSHFWDPLGLESEGIRVDFQVGVNSYLYGTRFMDYLAWTY